MSQIDRNVENASARDAYELGLRARSDLEMQPANRPGGGGAGMVVATDGGSGAGGADTTFAFVRTRFVCSFCCGDLVPAASRNSEKLVCRNASNRRTSGAACTSPLNPKYAVPL